MAGQDAVNAATAFSRALPLTGVILTKADGDAKGGVALSVRELPASRCDSSVLARKWMASRRFIPTEWRLEYSAWATC